MTEKQRLKKMYDEGNEEVKKALIANFGEKYFFTTTITARVKSFDDAIEIVALYRPYVYKEYQTIGFMAGNYAKMFNNLFKLLVITEALNEGWEPDWNDTEQLKYFPWFNFAAGGAADIGEYSGFGSVDRHSVFSGKYANIGGRLSFKSKFLAEYAGKTFNDIYKDFITS